ncbi:MAG: response regulator [Bacteroidetes bacterium]|nr:response regulator [Bacteroidota bacterium]
MKRILVIEDDEKVQESIVDLLEIRGYEILRASNGKDGLDLAVDKRPDLILCDVMMANLNGFSVLSALRAMSQFEKTPFIFLSALSEQKFIDQGLSKGANRYIVKPFKAEDLFSAIDELTK